MNPCNECRFCCYTWAVDAWAIDGPFKKTELTHCQFECQAGCSLHGTEGQPTVCNWFHCPYQWRDDIYRPDTFFSDLFAANGNIGNYIPAVLKSADAESVRKTIRETDSVPAAILLRNGDGQWRYVVLPLHRNPKGEWVEADYEPWRKINALPKPLA